MEDINFDDIINRLHAGKDVKCAKCGKGFYRTSWQGDISEANCFNCDKCGSMVHINPGTINVE